MRYIYILAFSFFLLGCDADYELKQSVFIEDAASPGLPEYSEWGYNTFGAYYGRETFISNDTDVPLNVIHEDDVTSFEFNGMLGKRYYNQDNSFTMTVTYQGFNPETFKDLMNLHDVVIDLKDAEHTVVFSDTFGSYQAEILSGQFQIKRAQYLLVDKKPTQVILSGVFQMQAVVNGQAITISDGRFDVGVSPDNFFNYL
jgi:hypothetical protein